MTRHFQLCHDVTLTFDLVADQICLILNKAIFLECLQNSVIPILVDVVLVTRYHIMTSILNFDLFQDQIWKDSTFVISFHACMVQH